MVLCGRGQPSRPGSAIGLVCCTLTSTSDEQGAPLLPTSHPLFCRGSAARQGAHSSQAGAKPKSQRRFQARWVLVPVPCHPPPDQYPVLSPAQWTGARACKSLLSGGLFFPGSRLILPPSSLLLCWSQNICGSAFCVSALVRALGRLSSLNLNSPSLYGALLPFAEGVAGEGC